MSDDIYIVGSDIRRITWQLQDQSSLSTELLNMALDNVVKALASFLLLGNVVGQNLNKPVLFSDGLSPHVDNVFWQYLNPTQSTWDQWGWGWIPQACKSIAEGHNLSPYDIEVYNVHYTDCSTAFVICRHNQAQMSVINMIGKSDKLLMNPY